MLELEETFIEEYLGATEQLEKGRYKNAFILFSKSLFALCDLVLYQKLKKLPKNHNDRFRMLEEYFPETYHFVDKIFSDYTEAYSKPVQKERSEFIQNGIRKLAEGFSLPESIKKIIKR